ncbi:unnamed protein product, partial [Amoebophrya sp. A25]
VLLARLDEYEVSDSCSQLSTKSRQSDTELQQTGAEVEIKEKGANTSKKGISQSALKIEECNKSELSNLSSCTKQRNT